MNASELIEQIHDEHQRTAYERLRSLLKRAGVDIGTPDDWKPFYRAARDNLTRRNGDSV